MDNTKKWNIKYLFFAIGGTFTLYMLRIFQKNDINISMDEIGTMAMAVRVGGLDWRNVLSSTHYYGGGYYWIYAVFFAFIDNPYVIAAAIYIANSMIVSLTTGLIYIILVKYLGRKNNWRTCIYAIIPGAFYHISAWTYVSNETPIYLLYWLLIIFVLQVFNSKSRQKKCICSAVAGMILSCSLTVHERTAAIWIAFLITVLAVRFFLNKRLIRLVPFLATCIPCYIVARMYKNYLIQIFWNSADSLKNTSAFGSVNEWFIDKPGGWKIVFDIIVTNLLKLCEASYGLWAFGSGFFILICVYMLYHKVFKGKRIRVSSFNAVRFILFVLGISCTLIMIIGLGVTWGKYVYDVFQGVQLGVYYRAYTYIRYWAVFAGPVIVAIESLLECKRFQRLIVYSGTVCFLCVLIYYVLCVHGYLFGVWNIERVYLYQIRGEYSGDVNTIISILMLFGIFWIYSRQNSVKIFSGVLSCLLLFSAVNEMDNFSLPVFTCETAGATYEFIDELRGKNIFFDRIYALNNVSTYQFMLKDSTISIGFPEEGPDALVLSNFLLNGEIGIPDNFSEYYYLQLDENEYLYVWGIKYRELLENEGIKLFKAQPI